mmetsp:Transcript_32313/g.36822  ORF Transcript_32313/g.36822 Transcript_32313/m.36822 type:complete len:202 (-) Transcript_32313:19-624(-)
MKNKDKEINYDAIFQYAMDVVKASDQVGPDPKFSGGMSKKKLACEAPPRIMESSNDAPFLGLNKAKSEKPQLSSKRIDEEKTAEKPLKPPEPKVIEEEKAEIKNEIASPSMNKKSPDEEKPRRGLMMMGKGLKGKPGNNPNKSPAQNEVNRDNKKLKPIGNNRKPFDVKKPGKGKSIGMSGIDSEDENDYPFDDGLKCVVQ